MKKSIPAFKGFNKDMKCRDFQYEVGKTYEHKGKVEACSSGFHACEHPLDVFGYYSPSDSRFAEVTMSGNLSKEDSDSKVASAKITIEAELNLHEYINKAVDYIFSKAEKINKKHNSGDYGAASNSGYQGAASNSGTRGAASNSGTRGAASNSGTRGAASTTGEKSTAMHCGYDGKVSGAEGCALFLAERDEEYNIINVWSGIVGQDDVKPDTWYSLKNGELVEVE